MRSTIEGKENPVVDVLSRRQEGEVHQISGPLVRALDDIHQEVLWDPELIPILESL